MIIKQIVYIFLISCLINANVLAQAVKAENKYGEQLYFVEGNTLKEKDKYGEDLFYWNSEEIKLKNQNKSN